MVVQGAILGAFIALVVAAVKWAFSCKEEEEVSPTDLFNTVKEEDQPNKWIGNGIEIVSQPSFLEPPIYVDKGAKVDFHKLPSSSMAIIYSLDSAISITVSKSRFDAYNDLDLMAFLQGEKIIITDGI